MYIYTIAVSSTEVCGHGENCVEEKICRDGFYGMGKFPPAFKTKSAAAKYLESLDYKGDKVIVRLELRD